MYIKYLHPHEEKVVKKLLSVQKRMTLSNSMPFLKISSSFLSIYVQVLKLLPKNVNRERFSSISLIKAI